MPFLILVVVLVVLFLWAALKVLKEYERGVIFRLGRVIKTKGPGLIILIPVIDRLVRKKFFLACFLLLLSWSIFVQVIGAFAYNVIGWNNKSAGYELKLPDQPDPIVVPDKDQKDSLIKTRRAELVRQIYLDIDNPRHRQRLWSIKDSQILYYLTNFAEARQTKHALMASWLRDMPGSKSPTALKK